MPDWRRAILIATATAVTAGAIAADVLLSACGSLAPSPQPLKVTISATGVSPASLAEPLGTVVQFFNQDSQVHDIRSNPHPSHTDCPELNTGQIPPGNWVNVTGSVSHAGQTCGYHDETRPDDVRFQGTIMVR
jgi:plastocyanin